MAIALSAALTASCAFTNPAHALAANSADAATKDETVYVVADANGNPTKEIISGWLRNTDGDDTNYQEHTDKPLPISTQITYELDGKEISPEDLAGASGHLVMKITYENQTGEKKLVNGKKVTMYQPFMAVSAVTFDHKKVSNVTVDHGKIMNTGDQIIVAGMAMPGLKESLGLEHLKDKDGKPVELGFGDTVTIEADVDEFALLTTVTFFDNSALQELDLEGLDALDDVEKDMDQLTDAADELEAGSAQLADGTGELVDGTETLISGIEQLNQGANQLEEGILTAKAGTGTLTAGITEAANGAGTLSVNLKQLAEGAAGLNTSMPEYLAGMKSLKQGTVTLKEGAATYVEGVNSYIDQASAGVKQLAAGGQQLNGLTNLGQVSAAVDQISDSLGNAETEGTLLYGSNRVNLGLKP